MPDASGKFKGISVPSIPWHDLKHPTEKECRMQHVIRYIRECEDEQRARRGEEPLTDREFADRLIAMKYTTAADELLGQMYAERDRVGLATNRPRHEQ